MAKKLPKSPILKALRRAASSEPAAYELLESQRWGDQPCCPRCNSVDVYAMKSRNGQRHKHFRWRCRDCARMFSVRTGTVLEESRLPLHIWIHAFWRACASKKGVSALQISRECGVTHKSALYLMHRIRLAMEEDDGPLLGGTVEVDETYIGGKPRYKTSKREAAHKRYDNKEIVFAMVERGGRVRAKHIARIHGGNLKDEIRAGVRRDSRVISDEARYYHGLGKDFEGGHETVNHRQREYVRGDITTNTVEGFFAILKRGIYGTFHSVSKHHLHRYVAEFTFKYNTRAVTDGQRTFTALRGAEGKRLLYRDSPLA